MTAGSNSRLGVWSVADGLLGVSSGYHRRASPSRPAIATCPDLPPTHQKPAWRATRDEHRRQQRIRTAHRAGWDELPRKSLVFGPFRTVTDERDGTRYTINRGEVDVDSANIAAYYIGPDGAAVFLEAKR